MYKRIHIYTQTHSRYILHFTAISRQVSCTREEFKTIWQRCYYRNRKPITTINQLYTNANAAVTLTQFPRET